jgi:outer membrane immunogenic protein
MGGAFRDLTETNTLGASTTHSSAGFVGGAQIGCDYQFAPGWLLGVDGRAAWTGLKSSIAGSLTNSTGVVLPSQFTATNDFLASATGRLGYSFFDRRLLFVKGGVAWTSEKADVAFTTLQGLAVDPSSSATLTGWTAGIGSEWAFAPSWSVSLETDYYDFGGRSLRLTAPNATVISNFKRDGILTVTAGLNYRF